MKPKTSIAPNTKIPLKLTPTQRQLLLGLPCLDPLHELALQAVSPEGSVFLTLEELQDLGDYICAEANHAETKAIEDKLDAIFDKIEELQEQYTGGNKGDKSN